MGLRQRATARQTLQAGNGEPSPQISAIENGSSGCRPRRRLSVSVPNRSARPMGDHWPRQGRVERRPKGPPRRNIAAHRKGGHNQIRFLHLRPAPPPLGSQRRQVGSDGAPGSRPRWFAGKPAAKPRRNGQPVHLARTTHLSVSAEVVIRRLKKFC